MKPRHYRADLREWANREHTKQPLKNFASILEDCLDDIEELEHLRCTNATLRGRMTHLRNLKGKSDTKAAWWQKRYADDYGKGEE